MMNYWHASSCYTCLGRIENQSRPIFLTDGSDFFIARLWQIYQRALIGGAIPDSGCQVTEEGKKMWQRILLIISAIDAFFHIATRF